MSNVSDAMGWIERKVPVWFKVLTAVAVTLATLWTAVPALGDYIGLRKDMKQVQVWQKNADGLLRFLVCRELRESARACSFMLRNTEYYDEFEPFLNEE